jgi:murein DD-endopeptidase MepM/ murein hydrolase activator NlpD
MRRYSPATLLALCTLNLSALHAQTLPVTLTPARVEAGAPELIHVIAGPQAQIDADWNGQRVEFYPARKGSGWDALAGVDVEAMPGASTLRIIVHELGSSRDLTQTVEIYAAHYRTSALTVAPKFVEPDPEQLARIKSDAELKARIFAQHAGQPLWVGNFRAPVAGKPTDSFGTRRMFNGKLASIHKGMDFRVGMGTKVRAANRGVVVLARPLYYEGNCVMIDHGMGLWTISMHLSRIDVQEGQSIAQGERVGLSGATGRVTGPHLHWAVRWQGTYLDPAKLLQLPLDGVTAPHAERRPMPRRPRTRH